MTDPVVSAPGDVAAPRRRRSDQVAWWRTQPWWALIIAAVMVYMAIRIVSDEDYRLAFDRIWPGIGITIGATLASFAIASAIGLAAGLGQVSQNTLLRNLARAYVEIVRGIPMLPLLFTVALVVVPDVSDALGVANRVSPFWRAVLALALIYGAYLAEIFRGGIQSVPRGQVEAGRSLGLTRGETMRSIVFPQAFRAIIPPIGNDFIAILKDTSLLSVLGILELTRNARQFTASTFLFPEGLFTLSFVYLTLVIALSLVLRRVERHFTPYHERS